MFKRGSELIFSPSDLVNFMLSPFASWMDRRAIEQPAILEQLDEEDELLEMLVHEGFAHEQALLEQFVSAGKTVIDARYNPDQSEANHAERQSITLNAIRQGADVIFQALLSDKNIQGYADFLVKDELNSSSDVFCYNIIDTKLARNAKPEHIIQLCCYADMLCELQGKVADQISVFTGDGQLTSFRTQDYFYYYLALKKRFLAAQREFCGDKMPDPFDSKSYGRWSEFAEEQLAKADHLSKVANVTRSQIKKLNSSGIDTCQELIKLKKETHIPGIKEEKLQTIIAQATIQKASEGLEQPLFEIKAHPENELTGLRMLPPHSDGDVFFDIEGFPLEAGGLEYLWGCTYFDEQGQRCFKDFWAHDSEQEKKAFSDFISWVYARWQKDPGMHIYHYASYEITACRKLMNRYGICEHEVDQLLRNEVFVDLYKIVKTALLIGEPRYSIKNVERLYRGSRDTEVGTGGDSIVVYEKWREHHSLGEEGDSWQTSKTLKDIRDYNIDDCNSTQELTQWLRGQQEVHNLKFSGKTEVIEPEISEEVTERMILRDEMLQDAQAIEHTGQAKILENMAWSLDFHRRELKPMFWRLFDRLGLEMQDLIDDPDCLANCTRTKKEPFKPKPRARNLAYEFEFSPNQEFKGNVSSYYVLGQLDKKGNNLKASLLEEESELASGIIVVTSSVDLPKVITLIPDEYVNPHPIPKALEDVARKMKNNPSANSAISDFLNRSTPRITGRTDSNAPIITDTDPALRLEQTIETVKRLDSSYITIQGPPGSGKTYTGKHIIAALLKEGKNVAISSNSHKAINNLLVGTAQYCREQGIAADFFCTRDTGAEIAEAGITVISNREIAATMKDNCCVVGTTAWGFSREELGDVFDYLFVDEAGQVAVANLVAMSRAADNLVLMGDQMQLGQPSQTTHPGDSGLSILDYLMHDKAIIEPNMGIFLGVTYRMHPLVNEFISEAIYEGQLSADPANTNQSIKVSDSPEAMINKSAGILYIPVYHEGNTQASEEEVDVIFKCAYELLGCDFTDKNGHVRQLSWNDMLFVAPYNHQVNRLKAALGSEARVGSVDKFQGQEAPVVFFSLCTSDASESPRGMDFLFDRHRLNVAISRAQALAVVVGNPDLFCTPVNSIENMKNVNMVARLAL